MARETTHLWAEIQAWLDSLQWPPSQAKLAARLGLKSRTVITDWKFGASRPTPEHLRALAREMELNAGPNIYERLLEAVNRDQGYLTPVSRVSERSKRPDLVIANQDGSISLIEVKGAGAVGGAAAKQDELHFTGAEMLTELTKGYVGTLVVAAHENPVAAGALNESLVERGLVDEKLADLARDVIAAIRALEDSRELIQRFAGELESTRGGLSDEDRQFLDEIAATMPESELGDNRRRLPTAARKMTSAGRVARAAQDAEAEAGEAWQDDGGEA